jgi:hypothetical protein
VPRSHECELHIDEDFLSDIEDDEDDSSISFQKHYKPKKRDILNPEEEILSKKIPKEPSLLRCSLCPSEFDYRLTL